MIPAPRKMSPHDRNLVKRAVKLSLDDLKANHSQAFLSSRALQVNSSLSSMFLNTFTVESFPSN